MSEEGGEDNEDTSYDHVTQMLPECFVSVKLEASDDVCEKNRALLHSQRNNSHNRSQANGISPVMPNLQQHCTLAGYRGSSHCFHPHCNSGMSELPQLTPWLSPCYSTQPAQSSLECSQSVGVMCPPAASFCPDGSANSQIERLLKASRGGRLEKPNDSNMGGNLCDPNIFFNYMLNQQRTGGVLPFDPTFSTQTDVGGRVSSCDHGDTLEAESRGSPEASSDSLCHKDAQIMIRTSDSAVGLPREETNSIGEVVLQDAVSVALVSADHCTPGSRYSIASKYSQTVPCASFSQDAKVDTDDCKGNSSTNPQKSCSGTVKKKINQCSSPDNDLGRTELKEGNRNLYSKCRITNQPCTNHFCAYWYKKCKCSSEFDNASDLEDHGCTNFEHNCHCINSIRSERPVKARNAIAHSVNPTAKLTSEAAQESVTYGRPVTSGSVTIKNYEQVQYSAVDRTFTCEVCFKNYPSLAALMNHSRYHRGERPYQCETCNKAFATNSHLVTHRRVHTGERPYQCQLCHKSFADRSAFVKHQRTHGPNGTIIKRFRCEECGNSFVDSCGLKKHIRIHTGERPYQCSICEKAFSTSSTFVAHKRIHSGERPYKCDRCCKMFITKSHLLTHHRTHTGEKPFTCHVCSRSFADGSSFRRHERLHTGENRYMCDVCGKGFPFDTSLVKHKQSHITASASYVYMV